MWTGGLMVAIQNFMDLYDVILVSYKSFNSQESYAWNWDSVLVEMKMLTTQYVQKIFNVLHLNLILYKWSSKACQ